MPYSTSVPITRRTLMLPASTPVGTDPDARPHIEPKPRGALRAAAPSARHHGPHSKGSSLPALRGLDVVRPRHPYGVAGPWAVGARLEVLAGVADRVDRAAGLGALATGDERTDVD